MGQPVMHFEVVAKDAKGAQEFYGELFDWEFDADNPMNYGIVDREKNLSPEGVGIGGGVGGGPEGYDGHLTFYVGVEDVEAFLSKAEELGGTRVMGPEEMETPQGKIVLGHFTDREGQLVGLVSPMD
jgi:predicted enzyme related to lactoylglutathione lyase